MLHANEIQVSRYKQLSDWSIYINSDHIKYPQLSPYVPTLWFLKMSCPTWYTIYLIGHMVFDCSIGMWTEIPVVRMVIRWQSEGGWNGGHNTWGLTQRAQPVRRVLGQAGEASFRRPMMLPPWVWTRMLLCKLIFMPHTDDKPVRRHSQGAYAGLGTLDTY